MEQEDFMGQIMSEVTPELIKHKARKREQLLKLSGNDPRMVDFLLRLSYDYNSLGFDYFIAYFLEKHFDYKMFVVDGMNDG